MQKKTSWKKTGFALCKTLDLTPHLLYIVSATDRIASGWNSGMKHSSIMVFRAQGSCRASLEHLAKPTFGDRACPHCNAIIPASYSEHLFTEHLTGHCCDVVGNKDFDNLFELVEAITSMRL